MNKEIKEKIEEYNKVLENFSNVVSNKIDKMLKENREMKERIIDEIFRLKKENKICLHCNYPGDYQDEDGNWICDEHYFMIYK